VLEGFSNVELVGWADFDRSRSYLAASHVGVIPFLPAGNHDRAEPNKLYEYAAFGLPVVCSALAALSAAVLGGGFGVSYDATDPVALAEAIVKLTADRGELGERSELATAFYRSARAAHDAESVLSGIYEELLDAPV
jgi:glycosyltransferase involved in cell wall biosynthesis